MYKPLQKKVYSYSPVSIPQKSKHLAKPGNSTVRAKPIPPLSESQELPTYSMAEANLLAENVLRGMQAREQEQVEEPTAQPQRNFWQAATAPAKPQLPSQGMGIQRQCSDCAEEEQQQLGEEEKDIDRKSVGGIQRKLTVGAPGDHYEQEADRVARQVMSTSVGAYGNTARFNSPQVQRFRQENNSFKPWYLPQPVTPAVQMSAEERAQMSELIQRTFQGRGYQTSEDLESRLNASKGGGSPLDSEVRGFMEPRFGADFSSVRVHTDGEAVQMNRELNAQAFTHGSDVYFGAGKSPGNNELTAHELTHVVQQNSILTKKIQQQANTDEYIQRVMGDGHDLSSPRFAGDVTLEDIYDGNTTLQKGDESDAVRKVQHGIHDTGILFLGHGIDGKFGAETERRVTSFQRRNGITTDPIGKVGAATIEKLDQLFPAVALPSSATSPYTFDGMLDLLCQWNTAMIQDLKNLHVRMVGNLEWADEEFDGSGWVPSPMPGAGETSGHSIIIAANGTNEEVARSLYHEYQHARQPVAYRSGDWGNDESRVYEMETYWAIDRGITPDPGLTTTDPTTGEVEIDSAGIDSTVESYPGLDAANPGEVIAKVGANRVRVRMPDGSITVRNAVAGDSIPGPRQITPPIHTVTDREWKC